VELVKQNEPITSEQLAEALGVSRPTLRSDLAILVMLGLLEAKPKVGYFLGSRINGSSESLQRLHALKVKDVQGLPIIIRESASIQDAVVTMFVEDVGSLIVSGENGEMTGIVSRKDLLKVTVGNSQAASMPVSLVMTRQPNIITVHPEDTVLQAAEKLIKHQIDSLPVIDGSDAKPEIVGRVSKTTMTRVLLNLAVH
jgi:CBS domain-containing protein